MRFRQSQAPRHTGVYLMEESGEAPVPPESPLMSTFVCMGLRDPAATVPTPTSKPYQLDRHGRIGVGILQVEDELR